jgi:uncharacterized damage-inducible protein DinB
MSQVDLAVEQIKLAFEGEPWHGPALMDILTGIDASKAAAYPIKTAHSIWELVLHIAAWENVIIRRLHGEALQLSDAENFGHIEQVNETNWKQAVETLRHTHAQLIDEVAALSEARLKERVPGKPYDILFMLWGAVQHVAYHGGQIALLKKAQA